MKGFFQSIFKISFLLAISFSSFGQVVTFSFTGGDGSQLTNAPDAQPSNATVSSMSRGSGLTTFNGFTNGVNAYEWGPAATLDANDYYEFTITPDAGYTMTLSSFVFDDRWVDPFANDTYFWTLRSSLDGFSSDVATPVSFAVTQAGSPDTHTGITFNLPGGTFTNVSTPITFRLYGYDVTNPGNLELGIDNVDLNGTINSPTKTSIATIDFESVNYTLSTPTGPDTDSFWAVFAASDEGTGHSFLGGAPAGVEGANYLAYRDGNNIGGTQTMVNTTPIDVSSFENIDLIFSLSNPDLGGDQYEITE